MREEKCQDEVCPLIKNALLKSSHAPGFLQEQPQVAAACERVAQSIFGGASRHPMCAGNEGVVLAAGRPHACENVAVNVERPAHLRQVFSRNDDKKKSIREDLTHRHLYPSGSGLQTAGICLDHAVVREFTADMDTIASAVKQWVIAKYGGLKNNLRGRLIVDVEYTSMTALAYYDKGQQRETLQLSQHRDCAFGPTGDFLDKKNTQRENTATVVVSLGDTRKLHMQAYRIDRNSHNKYEEATGSYSCASIDLTHGSLFALHCDDERPQKRSWFDETDLTFFKHGGVMFGNNNKFSIGLAFRVVTKSVEVRKRTGRVVVHCKEHHLSQDTVMAKECLNEYVANKDKWASDDQHRIALFNKMSGTFFTQQIN